MMSYLDDRSVADLALSVDIAHGYFSDLPLFPIDAIGDYLGFHVGLCPDGDATFFCRASQWPP